MVTLSNAAQGKKSKYDWGKIVMILIGSIVLVTILIYVLVPNASKTDEISDVDEFEAEEDETEELEDISSDGAEEGEEAIPAEEFEEELETSPPPSGGTEVEFESSSSEAEPSSTGGASENYESQIHEFESGEITPDTAMEMIEA